MAKRSVEARLSDILDHIAFAKEIVAGASLERYKEDRMLRLAVERAIEIISEATRHIPEHLRDRHPDVPWKNIMNTGNWLRHAYQKVDPELIWGVVERELDVLGPVIEGMLSDTSAAITREPHLQKAHQMAATRIDRRFAALKKEGRPALVTFITAGDPDYETSKAIALGLPAAGADVIELGMPFSDPMADGPAIQAAGLRALKAGQTMTRTLALVRDFRRADAATPIVLMGYYNPIYVYPTAAFLDEAKAAGVDGLIVVDVPPEADDELCLPAMERGLSFIRLATPTTDARRLPAVLKNTSGFVYYVSIAGITGAAAPDVSDVHKQVSRIKKATRLPVAVGFGVRTPEQARQIAAGADGVVVGSALVSAVEKSLDKSGKASGKTVAGVLDLVRSLAKGLRQR